MTTVKFNESSISEQFSKQMTTQNFMIGPQHTWRVITAVFAGVSTILAKAKNLNVPKGLVFKCIDGTFVAGAKVEFIPNGDNPANGRWDYTWSFYEEDFENVNCINATENTEVAKEIASSAKKLYGMVFNSPSLSAFMGREILSMTKSWLHENVKDGNPVELILPGAFKAQAEIEDGEVIYGIVPDGDMKVLIKDDSMIQE